jgi:hypothetical protein
VKRTTQKVYLGTTTGGQRGWLTNGILAWDIDEPLYRELLANPKKQKAAAAEYGFVLHHIEKGPANEDSSK